jgi:cell division septation protein DedD
MTLPPLVFIARFLQHVLPKGFAKVRNYGLLAPRNRAQLASVHAQLITPPPPATLSSAHSPAQAPTGASPPPQRCPLCHVGTMRKVKTLPPRRGPP